MDRSGHLPYSDPFIANPIASPATTTTYTLTFYAFNGCVQTDEITVNVTDVRCGNNMNKVLVCHLPPGNPNNPQTICIGAPAVPAHLAHGDYLGECVEEKALVVNEKTGETELHIYPNPAMNLLNIEIKLITDNNIEIFITNLYGTVTEKIFSGFLHEGYHHYSWNETGKASAGLYFLHVVSDEGSLIEKIVIN